MSLNHILLGFLQEPCSGYELKTMFDRSINYFWPAELSQIYRTLKRLEQDGLLRSRAEPSDKGPDRRVYALTAAGRGELAAWLESEPKFGDERFTYLAQIFFMGQRGDLNRTLTFVEQMRDTFRSRLATYRAIERDWRASTAPYPDLATDDGFHKHLTLRMGLHRTAVAVKWCDETIKGIKERMANAALVGGGKKRRAR
jgi:DNA-binding PadR family transcriptional regulator